MTEQAEKNPAHSPLAAPTNPAHSPLAARKTRSALPSNSRLDEHAHEGWIVCVYALTCAYMHEHSIFEACLRIKHEKTHAKTSLSRKNS